MAQFIEVSVILNNGSVEKRLLNLDHFVGCGEREGGGTYFVEKLGGILKITESYDEIREKLIGTQKEAINV